MNLSEIASRTGMSRAAMSLYWKGERGKNFPSPIARITTDSSLWDGADVAKWRFHKNNLSKEHVLTAFVIKEANTAIIAGEFYLQERLKRSIQACEAHL